MESPICEWGPVSWEEKTVREEMGVADRQASVKEPVGIGVSMGLRALRRSK